MANINLDSCDAATAALALQHAAYKNASRSMFNMAAMEAKLSARFWEIGGSLLCTRNAAAMNKLAEEYIFKGHAYNKAA